jgi:hypothetical protein
MNLYEFALENKEIFKLISTVLIGIICYIIVVKTNKLFTLSLHQGIRYFRNAFFFYGMAFITRYVLSIVYFFGEIRPVYSLIIKGIFEFLLIMAGFCLFYSLLWKKFERPVASESSLFNVRIFIFYCFALIIVLLDFLWNTYNFMFGLQIVLFSFASIVSFANYQRNENKQNFSKFYFLVILLNLIVWIVNFFVSFFLNWNKIGVIGTYILNIIIFFLFLYSVIRITNSAGRIENAKKT